MNAQDPMQALVTGMLIGAIDRMRDIVLIRELRHITPCGFEIVLGSRKVLSVQVKLLELGLAAEGVGIDG